MSIKNLLAAGLIVCSNIVGVSVVGSHQDASAAFDADKECPKSSIYKHRNDKNADGTNKYNWPADEDKKPKNIAQCNVIPDEDGKDVMSTVATVINVIVGVVGIVSVAMIVLGGISYATSQGDAAKAKKAQNTIIYSVVGLLISLLAFAIVNFVLTSVF